MKKRKRILDKDSATNLKVFFKDLGYSSDEYSNKPVLIFKEYQVEGEEKPRISLIQKGTLADIFKRTKKDSMKNLFMQINTGKTFWKERKTEGQKKLWKEKVEGRKKEDIILHNAFILDFDLKDEDNNHYKGQELIDKKKRLLNDIMNKLPLEADYIIESRNGFHVYYLINPIERKMNSEKWHKIEIGIFDYVKANISDNVDHAVKKSNQIMRVPYSFHKKEDDTDDGYQVKIIHERKAEEKNYCIEDDIYESAMFAYPTKKIIEKFKIKKEMQNNLKEKEHSSQELRQSRDFKISEEKESINNLKSKGMIRDKYEVTEAISTENVSYFNYLQEKTPKILMIREEATLYVKSLDMREILGFEKQGLEATFSSLFYEDKNPSDAFIKNTDGKTIYYCRRENKFYYDIFDIVHYLLKFEEKATEKEKWCKTFEFVYKMFGIKPEGSKEENKKLFDIVRKTNVEILEKVSRYSKQTKYLGKFVIELYKKLMELWEEHSEKKKLPWREVHRTLSVNFLAEKLGKAKKDSTISKGLLILEGIGLIKKIEGQYQKNEHFTIANEYQFSVLEEQDLEKIVSQAEEIKRRYNKPLNEVTRKGLEEFLRLQKK